MSDIEQLYDSPGTATDLSGEHFIYPSLVSASAEDRSPFLSELTDQLQIFSSTNPLWGIMESVVFFENRVEQQKDAPSDHDVLDRLTYRELLRILGDYLYSIVEGEDFKAVDLIEKRMKEIA